MNQKEADGLGRHGTHMKADGTEYQEYSEPQTDSSTFADLKFITR